MTINHIAYCILIICFSNGRDASLIKRAINVCINYGALYCNYQGALVLSLAR